MDNVTKRTIEIELGNLYDYKANYSKFKILQAERREKQAAAFKNQQREIEHTEKLIVKFRAKASKAKMAQSLMKQLDKMDTNRVGCSCQFYYETSISCLRRVLAKLWWMSRIWLKAMVI